MRFVERHGAEFEVRTFETPDQVLAAIRDEVPDALLCDIFFYRSPEDREAKEARVAQKAKQIENLAADLHSDEAAEGIGLIQRVRDRFHNHPPFPIYAYTSKGPYLLHNQSFDRLEELDALWLFKGRYSAQVERHRITKDIDEFRQQNLWTRRMWSAMVKGGVIGAALGVILDRIVKAVGF